MKNDRSLSSSEVSSFVSFLTVCHCAGFNLIRVPVSIYSCFHQVKVSLFYAVAYGLSTGETMDEAIPMEEDEALPMVKSLECQLSSHCECTTSFGSDHSADESLADAIEEEDGEEIGRKRF